MERERHLAPAQGAAAHRPFLVLTAAAATARQPPPLLRCQRLHSGRQSGGQRGREVPHLVILNLWSREGRKEGRKKGRMERRKDGKEEGMGVQAKQPGHRRVGSWGGVVHQAYGGGGTEAPAP